MRTKRTVWLVGMMGAGKSAIGPGLARRLQRRFVDTDAEIERRAGRCIPEIFSEEGEAAFRERERAAIDAVSGEPAVVALGGGAVAEPGAAERLASSGTLVYLRARPETLLSRVGPGTGRPLLEDVEPDRRLERLREILGRRRAGYEQASVVVDTDDLSPAEVADRIARQVGCRRGGGDG